MTHAQTSADGMSAPRPFLAVVWAALLTALLSALLPVGLPHSTTVGSAFNPATTSVALKARADRRLIAVDSSASGDNHGGPGGVTLGTADPILPAPDIAGLDARAAGAALPYAARKAPALPGRIVSAAYPRGPPLA